jgi:uncharacterized protein involved in tellurium resistance
MTTKQKAKKHLTKLLSEGAKEIRVTWEGGNDEGSFSLYVDDKDIDIDWNKKDGSYDLIDYIGDEIGYGSFAGDFNTNGEVVYDVENPYKNVVGFLLPLPSLANYLIKNIFNLIQQRRFF